MHNRIRFTLTSPYGRLKKQTQTLVYLESAVTVPALKLELALLRNRLRPFTESPTRYEYTV